MKRLILIEFNELCPQLLAKWMAAGQLPNFSKFYAESDVFTTQADEAEPQNLEPWIQWYSLHTGKPYSEHRVFHLTDGPKAAHDDVWHLLNAQGHSVWNCSSMNARRIDGIGASYLPDPWCDSEIPYPKELTAFQKFVSRQVKEYSNKDRGSSLKSSIDFLAFMATHGLSLETLTDILRQLIGEVFDKKSSWKRAVLLDSLQFDVFAHYFRNRKPSFSTFFVNSTAHFQHSYWRHMAPDKFVVKPRNSDVAQYGDAILFGYQRMDRLLGRFEKLARRDAVLVFATALSQRPYLKYEDIGGQNFYRPRDIEQFLGRLGIHARNVEPVMTHKFVARFGSDDEARDAREKLQRVMSSAGPVFGFDPAEPASVYFGCQLKTALPENEIIDIGDGSPFRFFDALYQIEGMKSGCHDPSGCLWIRQGMHKEHLENVSILDVLPTVLDFFEIRKHDLSGRSLLSA